MGDPPDDLEKRYEDREFVEAVEKHEPCGIGEVSEELDCGYSTARDRLDKIKRKGLIDAKKISSVWVFSGVEEKRRRVIAALRKLEIATAEILADELDEMVEREIEAVLGDLEDQEIVERRQVPNKDSEFFFLDDY